MRTKKQIKDRIIRRRAQMPVSVWVEKSEAIQKYIVEHPAFDKADEIFLFMSIKQEPDLRMVMEEAWKRGKKTAIPRVENGKIVFYNISNLSQTEKGVFGISEPTGTAKAEGKNVLMIMPGAAFDRYYNRIGYGGGYYDRYLEERSNIVTMAVCFSFQMLSSVPHEEHDIRPVYLLTEYGMVHREE